jgi:polar amino acid transport system ATP-binding protein
VSDRVTLNTSGRDPGFDAPVQRVPGVVAGADDSSRRWYAVNLQAFEGRYGDYVTAKVGKVFPQLEQSLSRPAGG